MVARRCVLDARQRDFEDVLDIGRLAINEYYTLLLADIRTFVDEYKHLMEVKRMWRRICTLSA